MENKNSNIPSPKSVSCTIYMKKEEAIKLITKLYELWLNKEGRETLDK